MKGGVTKFTLPRLTKIHIFDKNEARNFIKTIYKHRLLRNTEKNDSSSRSHVIIDMNIKRTNSVSKLRFCDLAGSERFPKNSKNVDKMQIKEMASINLSLSSLGRLVSGIDNGYDVKNLVR